jgi:NADH-quinone oxidoreductase subunit L
MEGPTPVSALIHAATMVAAGVYLVARAYGIFHAAGNALIWVAYVGALTAFLAATMGVVQNDIKRVLAYSTVSQLGYMLLALGVGGYTAGTFHLITHAYFKALLFLCAGSVIHALHTNDMWEMGAVGRKMKITAWTFLIGCLALAGIPPFSGFFSKDEILAALWNVHGHPVLTFVGFAVVFLTAFYMFRAYFLTFCGKDRTHHAPHENRPVMTVPLIILAFFALTAGWVGTPWHNMFAQFIHFGASHHEGINYAPMALSLLLALGGILSAKALYGQGEEAPEKAMWSRFKTVHRVLVEKYYMDHFWEWVVEKIVFVASRIASFIDEMIVDGLVRLTGWATLKASDALRPEQTGRVQAYAFVIVFTVACVVFLIGLLEPNYVYGFLNAIMMRAQ